MKCTVYLCNTIENTYNFICLGTCLRELSLVIMFFCTDVTAPEFNIVGVAIFLLTPVKYLLAVCFMVYHKRPNNVLSAFRTKSKVMPSTVNLVFGNEYKVLSKKVRCKRISTAAINYRTVQISELSKLAASE